MDQNGRFIILEANVQDHPFLFANLYAPNKTNEQSTFFEEIREELDNYSVVEDCNIVIGGDFNVIFDPDLDGNGGNPKRKESVKCINSICLANDLIDIWRIRHPNVKRFTWRQKMPVIQRRLDFWLVSNGMQEDIDNVDVIPSLKSDHSAIVLSMNGIENRPRGPSFWKLNSSLLHDKEYVSLINMKYPLWNVWFQKISIPPTEGFFQFDPPPPRIFHFRGLHVTPPTPWNFHDFSTWPLLPLGNSIPKIKRFH